MCACVFVFIGRLFEFPCKEIDEWMITMRIMVMITIIIIPDTIYIIIIITILPSFILFLS